MKLKFVSFVILSVVLLTLGHFAMALAPLAILLAWVAPGVRLRTPNWRPKWAVLTLALLVVPCLAFGADTATAGVKTAGPSPLTALIPVLVPVLIALLKFVVPNVPGHWLPLIAPLLGAGADLALNFAGVSTLGPGWGALLGSAGVGLREIKDQVQQRLSPPTPTPTTTS